MQDKWIAEKNHQPGDEYDPAWDLSGHMQDMNLIFQVIYEIANDPEMPSWLPGDEFENIR